MPEPLLTQFQEFGSVYLNPYEKKSNAPTEKLFRSVETHIQLLMMARYCVYKWISPFNEMVAKLEERSDKIMMDIGRIIYRHGAEIAFSTMTLDIPKEIEAPQLQDTQKSTDT